jgi:hypothetical protein
MRRNAAGHDGLAHFETIGSTLVPYMNLPGGLRSDSNHLTQ